MVLYRRFWNGQSGSRDRKNLIGCYWKYYYNRSFYQISCITIIVIFFVVNESYRWIPRKLYEEVKSYIDDLITNKWVKRSNSAYASPMVCVRKKDGSLRLRIDYCKLNNKTISDIQPIPKVQDMLDCLEGQQWFSTFDMGKAYHQGYIYPDSRKYTAFTTPWSLYGWIRIPYGLTNAPPCFQHYINETVEGLRDLKISCLFEQYFSLR